MTAPAEIANILSSYWTEVWRAEPPDALALEEVLRDVPTALEFDFTAAVLAVDEATLWETLLAQKNTTPGPDGFPFQAYLPFGLDAVKVLRDLLLETARSGECMDCLKEGSLFLIPKKGTPTKENLRPITVANTSYRYMMNVARLVVQSRVAALLSLEQKAFVKGRKMGVNTAEVLESFYMDKALGHPARYVFIDFAKAYDRVHREALYQILRTMGFGEAFVKVVRALNSQTSVSWAYGEHVRRLSTDRGVRQAAPSPPFFLI